MHWPGFQFFANEYSSRSIAEVAVKLILTNLLNDDDGVTAIEYGLLGALIAVAIVASVSGVGNVVLLLYTAISNAVIAAIP